MLLASMGFFLKNRALQPEGRPHSRGVAPSGFRPLRKIPYCCLPQESGPCLSPSVADHPLRSATHRCLGEPLPHQQANAPRAHPQVTAIAAFYLPSRRRKGLSGISSGFPELSRSCGQVAHVLLTRSPLGLHPEGQGPARLACIRHAASVHPEPGSNSPTKLFLVLSAPGTTYPPCG